SRPLTPSTHEIRIEKPKAFVFRPTQFTFLQLKTDEGMDARPMSLASSPTRPHLEYAVRLSDSPYKRAFAALQPGDEVRVFGPIGDFVLHETRPAVLLAGGVGITPLKGMAEYAADKALPIPVRLVYSNRSEDEILYRDELDSLAKQNPNFRVFYTLTRSSADGWRGLDQLLLHRFGDPLLVLLGQDRLRREGVHADAERSDLRRQMLREDLDAGLRGRVRHRRPGIRPAGGRGRHCEDRAGLPPLHPGED